MTQTFRLIDMARRKIACQAIVDAPQGAVVTIRERTRTLDQNARMWAMLGQVAKAEPEGRQHTPDVWKCLFMHALGYETRFVMGLNGEPFPAGFRSSRLSVRECSDLIDFMTAWCAERSVILTEPDRRA